MVYEEETLSSVNPAIGFEVKLPDFVGPMDLLIFLIRRRELDIAYISVSAIASDFLEWLSKIEQIELDNAGDFILLAATLLQFKVNSLLIGNEPEYSEAEQTILERHGSTEEIMALRNAIQKLSELESQQINLFDRGSIQFKGVDDEITEEMLSDVSVVDLALIFRDVIYKLPKETTHLVETVPYTLEGQMVFILSFFKDKKKINFHALSEKLTSRLSVIMTFLAILELIRLSKVRVMQNEPFGTIYIIRTNINIGHRKEETT